MKKLLILFILISSSCLFAQQYTLTDADVELDENGYITSCSYDFALKEIIIPQTLDGMEVKGIADAQSSSTSQFADQDIESLQLPSSIKYVGNYAFDGNLLDSIILPVGIEYIGEYAFYDNELDSVDLPNTVTFVGRNAFRWNNFGFETFILPVVDNANFIHWISSEGEIFDGGTEVTFKSHVSYFAKITYTLTDDDVIVNNGIIDSVTYNFEHKFIIIPDFLDGQDVTGIADAKLDEFNNAYGLFVDRGLKEVTLPSTIEVIGNHVFLGNQIDSMYFPASIQSIGNYAFFENSLDVTEFESPSNLKSIKRDAFKNNAGLSLDLPTSIYAEFENWVSGDGTYYNQGDNITIGNQAVLAKIVYTLTDEDVSVTDGIIDTCFYDFESKFIVVPQVLDGQTIIGIDDSHSLNPIFQKKGIWEITLPPTIEILGVASFFQNNLNSIELSSLTNLNEIGDYAFYSNSLDSVVIPSNVTTIGENAFAYNTLMDTAYFQENSKINFIGSNAFSMISGYFSIMLPTPIKDGYVFEQWEDGSDNTFNGGETITNLSTSYTAQFSLDPSTSIITVSGSLEFGDIEVDHTDTLTFSIGNEGLAAFSVTDIQLPQGFSANWTTGQVEPSAEQQVEIVFAPTLVKSYSGYINVISDATTGLDSILVSGNGTPALIPMIVLSGTLSFGDVKTDSTKKDTFLIKNSGTAPLVVSDVEAPNGFTPDWTSGTVAVADSQMVIVTFAPTEEKSYDGYIFVNSNKESGNDSIEITGSGIIPDDDPGDDPLDIKIASSTDGIQLLVYPNPVSGLLNVESATKMAQVKIFDLNGKILYGKTLSGKHCTIPVEGLSKGCYFISAKTSDGRSFVKKFIK